VGRFQLWNHAAQRYLHPEYSDSTVSTTAIEWDVPVAFTATSMYVRVNTAATGTGNQQAEDDYPNLRDHLGLFGWVEV